MNRELELFIEKVIAGERYFLTFQKLAFNEYILICKFNIHIHIGSTN